MHPVHQSPNETRQIATSICSSLISEKNMKLATIRILLLLRHPDA